MAFNLAWIKQHKAIVAGIVLGGLVLIYLAKRSSVGSSSGAGNFLAAQQQGQLQMAQLNAQLSAQGDATHSQLESQLIAYNAEQQHSQDQIAGEIALYGLQHKLQSESIAASEAERAALLPSIKKLLDFSASGKLAGHNLEQQTITNELALLLASGGYSNPNSIAGSLPPVTQSGQSAGFNINIPGIGSLGVGGI